MREILQSSSPNKDHELKCSAADTCRISQPMQCCTERPLLLKEGKSQRLLTQTSVLAGKGVWGEAGGGPDQWGDKLWKGGWSENITKLFHVFQSLRLEKQNKAMTTQQFPVFFLVFFIAKVFLSSTSSPQMLTWGYVFHLKLSGVRETPGHSDNSDVEKENLPLLPSIWAL